MWVRVTDPLGIRLISKIHRDSDFAEIYIDPMDSRYIVLDRMGVQCIKLVHRVRVYLVLAVSYPQFRGPFNEAERLSQWIIGIDDGCRPSSGNITPPEHERVHERWVDEWDDRDGRSCPESLSTKSLCKGKSSIYLLADKFVTTWHSIYCLPDILDIPGGNPDPWESPLGYEFSFADRHESDNTLEVLQQERIHLYMHDANKLITGFLFV